MPTATSPTPPKVHQVLHVRAKSILSCTFGRSAASERSGVAPPPSYQSVTLGGVTTLLYLNSRDGTVRNVGSVEWDMSPEEDNGGKKRAHKVAVGEHTSEFGDVLRTGKGIGKDLKFKSDTRALHLPGSDSGPLVFQRVAIPSGGFPYTVYTITDTSLPPGPTPAHTCVGQLTVKYIPKPRASSTTDRASSARLWSFLSSDGASHPKPKHNVGVRLELRTRDKPLIDRIVFSSLLIIAGKHPNEADSRVEIDRRHEAAENEWDAPPALSNLATPLLSPNGSAEHLPVPDLPQYGDNGSREHLLPPADPSTSRRGLVDADQSVPGPSAGRSVAAA